jgi:phage protein D
MLLGISLRLMIGPTRPVAAPAALTEALVGVEATLADRGRSGFQLTFQVGRSGPADLRDYALLANPLLRPFNRVVLEVTFNARPRVLMDGFITTTALSPSEDPGASTFTVTGEDVSVVMDLVENKESYAGQSESEIAGTVIERYKTYLTSSKVVHPFGAEARTEDEAKPNQGPRTDLAYLTELAGRFGHVFYVTPGPAPQQNRAYWGPPERVGLPQPALAVNMGPESNVDSVSFTFDAMAPTIVSDTVQDSETNKMVEVAVRTGSRRPPLAAFPAPTGNRLAHHRVSGLGGGESPERGGITQKKAMIAAQSQVDSSIDQVVTATGELDALRYGDLLTPRGLVGLRGAGFSYDGMYYVKSVTHSIRAGSYKQRFTLTREGVGATTPFLRP